MLTYRARVVGFVVAVVALTMLAAPALAHANAVTQWNQNASNALIDTAGQAPTVAVLHLAMVHGAVYDAVNAIDRGYCPYLVMPRVKRSASTDAAAATAAYRVLVSIVPAQQPALQALYESSLDAIPDGRAKTRGVDVGEAAAAAMIAARTNDGRFGAFRFTVGTLPGEWRPVLPAFASDPAAWVKDVKPFLIRSSSQFRSKGPNALTSHKYAKELAEVQSLGSATSTTRTSDQTLAAQYWAEHPPRTWSRILRTIAAQEGLSNADSARLFAMVYLTAADALITVWDDKEYWSFWRPITAIREADTDGNDATDPDAGVAAADRDAAVPGASIRSPGDERVGRGDAAGVLRYGQDRVDRHQQRRADSELHELVAGAARDRRCASVVRNPLPHCGRAERPHRETGSEVAGALLLPAAPPPSPPPSSRLMPDRRVRSCTGGCGNA